MIRLSKRQVLLLHAQLIVETGGTGGVRDETLLDAAIDAPYSGLGDDEFFPTVEAKAARLAFGLVGNHPFIDGNKRIGVLAMLVLLDLNGVTVECEDADLTALGLALAQSRMDTAAVETWIACHRPTADQP